MERFSTEITVPIPEILPLHYFSFENFLNGVQHYVYLVKRHFRIERQAQRLPAGLFCDGEIARSITKLAAGVGQVRRLGIIDIRSYAASFKLLWI